MYNNKENREKREEQLSVKPVITSQTTDNTEIFFSFCYTEIVKSFLFLEGLNWDNFTKPETDSY